MMVQRYAPYILASASAGVLLLAALPVVLSDTIAFRRWYRWALGIAGSIVVVSALLGLGRGSAWVVAGMAAILVAAVVWHVAQSRVRRVREDEALEFLHSFVAVMGVEKGLREALPHVARDAAFGAAHPRMTEAVRRIVAEAQAGAPLQKALAGRSMSRDASGAVWRQMATLAAVLDEGQERIAVGQQRDALEVAWRVLYRVRGINRRLRQDMAPMEMAKWLFVVILPGMNLLMARMIHDYKAVFVDSLVGRIVLGFEIAALATIFLVFSRLQNLPEVKL